MEPPIFPVADIRDDPSEGSLEANHIRGSIDAVSGGVIKGWAFNELSPDHPLTIEVYEGDQQVSSSVVDKLRIDVAEAGFGNGFSGYEIAVPRRLFDGLDHLFEVRAVMEGGIWRSLGQIEMSLPAPPDGLDGAASIDQFPDEIPTVDLEAEDRGEPEEALGQIRMAYVEEMLATALARVDELESSERNLMNERDLLRHQVASLNDHIGRELRAFGAAPHRFAPGEFDGAGVRTTDVTRRRDAWLNHLSRHGVSGPIFALGPHDGQSGPLNILICGSGGIGDAIYLSTVVREIALLFPTASVFVLHENGRATDVLRGNPYCADLIWLEGSRMQSFIRGCHELDVFDLIVDVRYAVTYSAPPLSRIPFEFVRDAGYRSAEWQKYVRFRWPHLNNLFAEEVIRRGMSKLDLVGWTSMLPIRHESEVDFFLDFADPDGLSELRGKPYVTIHHGADPKMVGQSGLQTKNLPIRIWAETVTKLKKAGFSVVQLGEAHEERIEGIDVDLRGRTGLDRTACVLKNASVHLDSEGGLVHLARSVNTPSVVAFGPTPTGFFGYPQNANLAPKVCGGCWWTTDRWAQECPRGLAEPECMSTHSPKLLASEAMRLSKDGERIFEIVSVVAVSEAEELAVVDERLSAIAGNAKSGAIALGWLRTTDRLEELKTVPGTVAVYVPGPHLRIGQVTLRQLGQVKAYSRGNVPINSASLDWAAVIGLGIGAAVNETVSVIVDFSRALRPGGVLFCTVDADEFTRTPGQALARLVDIASQRPGSRFPLRAAPGVKTKSSGAAAASFLVEIRQVSQEAALPPVGKPKTVTAKPVLDRVAIGAPAAKGRSAPAVAQAVAGKSVSGKPKPAAKVTEKATAAPKAEKTPRKPAKP